jgi:DNA-binding MurR/RpiR family transcriptional regulator
MNAKQEKALAALLIEPTIKKAAASAGCSEPTLLRWLKETDFKEAYRDARREVVALSITRLQSATGDAVQTLCDVANDGNAPASSRVAASKAILDTSLRVIELDDLASRLEALEGAMKDNANSQSTN